MFFFCLTKPESEILKLSKSIKKNKDEIKILP